MTKTEQRAREYATETLQLAESDPTYKAMVEAYLKGAEDADEKYKGYEHIVLDMQEHGFDTYMSVKEFLQKHEELKAEYSQTEKEFADLKIKHHDYAIWATNKIAELEEQIKLMRKQEVLDQYARFPM